MRTHVCAIGDTIGESGRRRIVPRPRSQPRWPAPVSALLACLALAATAAGQPVFQDRTVDVGLTATHFADADFIGGQWWMAGGLAVGDFNNDTYPDVFWISGGAGPDRLFINDGTGNFTNESIAWGLTDLHCGVGASAADYDGDGDVDLYVTSWGRLGQGNSQPGQHRLYRNDGGSFTNVASTAGVTMTSTTDPGGYGSAWGDYDLDGDLDLFVAHWHILADGNRLYRNDGDGTFTDVTATAIGSMFGIWGFQPVFADMNGDRWPELLLSADFLTSRYYVNNADGTFTEFTGPAGVGIDEHGMGNTVGDVNNDGLLDWYVTSIHEDIPDPGRNVGNMLYVGQGAHAFIESSTPAGCNDGGWGWGTTAADLDNDGWLDLLEVNGRAGSGTWEGEPAKLFHNQTSGAGAVTFVEMAAATGFVHAAEGTAVACLDSDQDGDLDIVSFANNGAFRFFENKTPNAGSWLAVTLDTSANDLLAPNGFGARITVNAGGQTLTRIVDGRPSYLGTGAFDAHFGLGDSKSIHDVTVQWPRGQVSIVATPSVDQRITIVAPALGDLDDDGDVDFSDLLGVLGAWGTCGVCPADLNADGDVGFADVLVLVGLWGSV